jgi:uncharacterized protein YbaP (TraB family)
MRNFGRFSFSAFIMFTHIAIAQVDKGVLWKIEGNGLKTPSYLFGTIHINDKRVFDLQDSVLAKLKECSVSVFELDFDSMAGTMLTDGFEKAKKKNARELLSKNEVERLKVTLKARNISTDNIEKENTIQIYRRYNYLLKKNQMSTFLDGYLFGIARSYGKQLLALETYAEQEAALNTLQEEEQKAVLLSLADSGFQSGRFEEKLLQLYLAENIEGLFYLITGPSGRGDFEEKILTKRNYVMDRRIDSLVQKHATFFAVGVGHLPGEEGLLGLLRKRGYRLTPVNSPRSNYYKKLLPGTAEENWKTITDETGGFKIKMPGQPVPMVMNGLEMKGYIDLSSGHFYMATGVPAKGGLQASKIAYEKIMKRFESKGKVGAKKYVSFRNMEGYESEAEMFNVGKYMVRVLSDSSSTYILMVGLSATQPDKNLARIFFGSLQPIERKFAGEIVFRDDTAAFRITVPSNFKLVAYNETDEATTKSYSCLDYKRLSYISVTCTDYKTGLYFPDIEKFYEASIEPVKLSLKAEPTWVVDTVFYGYKARDYKITANDNSIAFLRYILKGARAYTILVTSKTPELEKDALSRLSTFEFVQPLSPRLISYLPPQRDFKMLAPGPVSAVSDSMRYNEKDTVFTYGSSDANSGQWFEVFRHHFSDFDYYESDSALSTFLKTHIGSSLQLLDSSVTVKSGIKVFDFRVKAPGNPAILQKVRALVNGRNYYLLLALEDSPVHSDTLIPKLFNAFEILKPDTSFNVFSPKTEKLFLALGSADSLVRKKAKSSLRRYTFKRNDLSVLKAALKTQFSDDEALSYNTKHFIYQGIYSVLDSVEMVNFIRENYSAMPDSGMLRLEALNQLARFPGTEAFGLWKTNLLQGRPRLKNPYSARQCSGRLTYDSIPEAKELFPALFPLMDDENYKSIFYSIAVNSLKFKTVPLSVFEAVKSKLTDDALKEYALTGKPDADGRNYYSPSFYDQLSLLNNFSPTGEITSLNQNIISDTFTYSKVGSVLYLAKNNIEIKTETMKKFLAPATYRSELFEGLKDINRLEIFPAGLKKQKFLAEGDMFSVADYEGGVLSVDLIDERKIKYNGELQRFYLYKINFADYSTFGVAGPYPLSDKDLVARGSATNMSYEEFGTKTVDEHLAELLNNNN